MLISEFHTRILACPTQAVKPRIARQMLATYFFQQTFRPGITASRLRINNHRPARVGGLWASAAACARHAMEAAQARLEPPATYSPSKARRNRSGIGAARSVAGSIETMVMRPVATTA